MSLANCPLCGAEIRWVNIEPTMEMIALDTIASVDGEYLLNSEDAERGRRMTRTGHSGFKAHRETCPKQGGIGR